MYAAHCLMPGGLRNPWLSLKSVLGIVFLADRNFPIKALVRLACQLLAMLAAGAA
jgi:hypothetical protein